MKQKQITTTDLLKAIQKLPTKNDVENIINAHGFATKNDVKRAIRAEKLATKEYVHEGTDVVLEGVAKMNQESKEELIKELKKVESSLKTEFSFVKDDIKGLTAELSNTPTRAEFNQLKARVNKHFPLQ